MKILNRKVFMIKFIEQEKKIRKKKSNQFRLSIFILFKDNPYKVLDNAEMDELAESIGERGILTPLILKPKEDDPCEYEIISGHRRFHAAKKAGLETIPAFIYDVSKEEAAIMVVDSNLHRERILPSEKAFAYKLKYEALKTARSKNGFNFVPSRREVAYR